MATSRITKFVVKNYQAHKHAELEFGNKNIIDVKGTNNSGKSALLRAMESLLMDSAAPMAQSKAVRDGSKSYQVEAHFDDGIVITKEKAAAGSSWWEMTDKNNKVLVSTRTKSGKAARSRGIPEPIQEYLGMVTYEQGKSTINYQNAGMPPFLAGTKGSENYEILSSALGSEILEATRKAKEADHAKAEIVNQKWVLVDSVTTRLQEIPENIEEFAQVLKDLLAQETKHKEEKALISQAEERRVQLGIDLVRPDLAPVDLSLLNTLNTAADLSDKVQAAAEKPTLDLIDSTTFKLASSALGSLEGITEVRPEIQRVELSVLNALKTAIEESVKDVHVRPKVEPMSSDSVQVLNLCKKTVAELGAWNASNEVLSGIESERDELQKQVDDICAKHEIVICENCGHPVMEGKGHND